VLLGKDAIEGAVQDLDYESPMEMNMQIFLK
jgi:hypothetical protein